MFKPDMVFRVTDQNIQDLSAQAEQQGECISYITGLGTRRTIPKHLGKGYNHSIDLRKGLTIRIFNGQFWQSTIHERHHEETFPIVAKFYLSGGLRVKTDNVPEIVADYEETAGHNYLYHLPDLTELEEYPSHIFTQTVMILADTHYLSAINSAEDSLPNPLQCLTRAKRFHQPLGNTTLAMTQILQQILHCPYQGATQQLYLESKALELLALQFACLETEAPTYRRPTLKAADLEQVRYARDILVGQLCDPPSLIDLAHLCGLNEFKLKQGFRQLFGTTVFGYLYNYRMEQAQHLLHSSQLSIAAVSAQVGYRSPEAFSTAFRRKFAVSPKAYQLGRRGKV